MSTVMTIAAPREPRHTFQPQTVYVWASCPISAMTFAGKDRREVAQYATKADALAAQAAGDDGFEGEYLFTVRIVEEET